MTSELDIFKNNNFKGKLKKPFIVDVFSLKYCKKSRINPIIGIYKITSPSGKIYIGQALDIENRLYIAYKRKNCKSQKSIYNSLIKYGVENHKFEIIHIVKKYDNLSLDKLEINYIKLFDTYKTKHGLNLTKGGNSGRLASEETKKRMSIANKGRVVSEETRQKLRKAQTGRKHTEEHRQKNRDVHLGDKNHFYGKTHTEEVRRKSSEWHKANQSGENHPFFGKNHSDEAKEKMSKAKIGTKKSSEDIKRQSERVSGAGNPMYGSHRYGEENPMFGKRHSDETKKKIAESRKGIKASDEAKKNMSNAQKGRKHSEETKKKMSESRKSKNIVVSYKTKKKISETLNKNNTKLKNK